MRGPLAGMPNEAGKENEMNENSNTKQYDISADEEQTMRERAEALVSGAADDFQSAYHLIGAAVRIALKKPHKGIDTQRIARLMADRDDALALSKRLGAIADFADGAWEMYSAVMRMYRGCEFGIDVWNVAQGAKDADALLLDLGVSTVTGADDDTGEEFTVYDAKTFSVRSLLVHVIELRRFLARQYDKLDPAAPACFDLARAKAVRAELMGVANHMAEYTPERLGMSEGAYAMRLAQIAIGIEATGIVKDCAEAAVSAKDCGSAWRMDCASDDVRSAKIAILDALYACPAELA